LASCIPDDKVTLRRVGGDWEPQQSAAAVNRPVSTLELALVAASSAPQQGGAAAKVETQASGNDERSIVSAEERLRAWNRAAGLYQTGQLWEALAAFQAVSRIAPEWARPRLYVGLLNRCTHLDEPAERLSRP